MKGRGRHIATLRSSKKRDIYFIEADGVRVVKIGITDRLADRISAMRCNSPVPLTLLLVVKGTRRQERALHQLFASDRAHGEWFQASDRLRAFIDGLKAMPSNDVARYMRGLKTTPIAKKRTRQSELFTT